MCTISISLFFENKKHVDLCVMRDAAQEIFDVTFDENHYSK